MQDWEIWQDICTADLWIFDKLILSKKLQYNCGPIGVDPIKEGDYIIRPCVNLLGMGKGAFIRHLEKDEDTDYLPAGYFWCEVFEGDQYSVDYVNREQQLTTQGIRKNNSRLWKWDKWIRVEKEIPYPSILNSLVGKYQTINCEFIGDKLIEVHLRSNNDMEKYNEIIPVWKEDDTNISKWTSRGYEYIEDPDLLNEYNILYSGKEYARLGFLKK